MVGWRRNLPGDPGSQMMSLRSRLVAARRQIQIASHTRPFVTRSAAIQSATMLDCSNFMGMRWRRGRTLVIVVALFLLESCGLSGELNSDDADLAARGRALLVATFTDTPWRLPPEASPECTNERQSSRITQDFDGLHEDDIYCSLNSSAMAHLLGRLNQGLGTDVTATEKTCISKKVTRDQVAALLAAQQVDVDDRAAIVAEFDDQLASVIRQCTSD